MHTLAYLPPRFCALFLHACFCLQVAHLQDAMVHALKGLSLVAHEARKMGIVSTEADRMMLQYLFSTLTNVNFDPAYFDVAIPEAVAARDSLRLQYNEACTEKGVKSFEFPEIATWRPKAWTREALEEAGMGQGVLHRRAEIGEEAAALQEMCVYGLKGAAAYACHAMEAGKETDEIYMRLHKSLATIASNETDLGKLVAEAMYVGETNVKVLAALDSAHTEKFGAPVPTPVNHAPIAGKCILISGHDLVDLEALLQQTVGKGINVYTHGEMLPAHGYPGLKAKYPHLVGHWGQAWQLQRVEYAAFPGPIIQSTNCIMPPRSSYQDRLFTTNATGWPGCTHIEGRDFSSVIAKALSMDGFKETRPAKMELTGFGHNAVLGAAGEIVKAVQEGRLTRFVLIGGCDGSEADRSYYTRLATALPDTAAILTLGCGKYRVLGKKAYGNIPGTAIPRVLDMGQCNDAYSAVVVAMELAKVFKTDVNGLPLSIVLSWFEQKAVAVLLSLLSLGVKNVRIGPALPAFITPKTLEFLQDNFNLMPIKASAKDGDVDAVMGRAA